MTEVAIRLLVAAGMVLAASNWSSGCTCSPAAGEDGQDSGQEEPDGGEEGPGQDDPGMEPEADDPSGSDDGEADLDGDGGITDGGGPACPEPEPHQRYCIQVEGWECLYERSFCWNGEWTCYSAQKHPPPMPEFEDWAWRCEVVGCDAQRIPAEPGPDWQGERPYVPPDPGSLTGTWRLVSSLNAVVPVGCERQPRQYGKASSLAVSPANPDVMYIGFNFGFGLPPNWISGVFKSVDGGRSWFEARAGLGAMGCMNPGECFGTAVIELFLDPDDPELVFASTGNRGLYRTADGGRHWEFVTPAYWCYWAGPVGKAPDGVYHTACFQFPFVSRDQGRTWEGRPGFSAIRRTISAFAFDTSFPRRVWAGMSIGSTRIAGEGYLFLSEDGGQSWSELGQDVDAFCQGGGGVTSIGICKADPDQMALAVYQCGIFLSSDGGSTFQRAGPPEATGSILSVKYAPQADGCRLYVGDGLTNGLWWTEDGGQTWSLEIDRVLDWLVFNPFVPEVIHAARIRDRWLSMVFELWVRE